MQSKAEKIYKISEIRYLFIYSVNEIMLKAAISLSKDQQIMLYQYSLLYCTQRSVYAYNKYHNKVTHKMHAKQQIYVITEYLRTISS